MRIAVVGGTGTIGREAVRELARRGHEVRALARRSPGFPVDLRDGSGLAAALAGVDVVVDAVQGRPALIVEGTKRLLRAEAAAGVRHHVGVSIVGIENVGGRYYRAKLEQERLVAESGLPWTIVRATQFHQLIARTFALTARFGVIPAARVPLQPVDPREVARVLADTAEEEPTFSITQFAGPEVVNGCELAYLWKRETGSRALRLPIPATRSLAAGGLTHRGAWRGRTSFRDWLASAD